MRLLKQEELINDHYKKLHKWDTREYFANNPRHYWTIHYRNRLKYIVSMIKQHIPAGSRILDVGCAQGTAALLLAEEGYQVTAIEASLDSIQYAKARYEFGDIEFICGDITTINLDHRFACIIFGEVLEHIPRPGTLLSKYKQNLLNDGIIVITTPNGSSPHNWLIPKYNRNTMENITRSNIKSGLGGRETHLFCFKYGQLRKLVTECGFGVLNEQLLNSYCINPFRLHEILPLKIINSVNNFCSRLPIISTYTTMTQCILAKYHE